MLPHASSTATISASLFWIASTTLSKAISWPPYSMLNSITFNERTSRPFGELTSEAAVHAAKSIATKSKATPEGETTKRFMRIFEDTRRPPWGPDVRKRAQSAPEYGFRTPWRAERHRLPGPGPSDHDARWATRRICLRTTSSRSGASVIIPSTPAASNLTMSSGSLTVYG